MPELPEVEIVRRGLEKALCGEPIARLVQRRPNLRFPLPENFAKRLTGVAVQNIERRAKYLLAHLSSSDVLLMHLGMSGRFLIANPRNKKPKIIGDYAYETGGDPIHDHVVIHLGNGTVVTYNDPRRFGFMLLVPGEEIAAHPLLRHLGVEPLGNAFSPAFLAMRAKGRKGSIKALLMDQRVIAGLGNIYVCEALHRAGISPKRSAAALALRSGKPSSRAERLVPEIRAVLSAALGAGGSTLKDYRQADGRPGGFQTEHRVYDREGLACLSKACTGTIRRMTQAGRSTFYCPQCQR